MDTPTVPQPEIQAVKKKHKFRWLYWLVGIIVVILIAISATGVYAVPGVSAIFGMNKPKDLGIKVTEEAYNTIKQKIPLQITGEKADYSASPATIFTGSAPVDTQNTSEEVTSWLAKMQGPDPIISQVQVKMIEGGVEFSGQINKYLKSPVYAKVMINRTSENSVSIDITSAKLGIFNVPQKYVQQFEDWALKQVNGRMATIPGFSLQQLEYHDGYDIWKGTVPAQVKPAKGGWTDLVLE
ncbi:hypothetical protein C4546_01285 [Candidatus Parcubacteria bacterium]|jgi:hypothetical protein|nr:MAG: hypothetical protein C4546_01285 [Candidatus Parcubacteria bacterium]